MSKLPDREFNEFNPNIQENFATFVTKIHDKMQNDIDIPMPPLIEDPVIANETLKVSWTPAFYVTRSHTLSYDQLKKNTRYYKNIQCRCSLI